jgi:flagellar secretion chaperone FliS
MISNPYQQYRTTSVETARPIDLVLMLYKALARFTQRGIQAVERQDVAEAHASFVRAQDIVAELASGLDAQQGGAIAAYLEAIYDYVNRLLIDANCRKTIAPAAEALRLMTELQVAWQAIADGKADETLDATTRLEAPAR